MFLILPACAAALYALGSMGLKLSMLRGTPPRRVMAVSNIAMAAWSLPLVFFFPGTWNLQAWLAAVAAGAALFVGRIFAVKALEAGDLSVVAPLLGMKTILVAALSMVLFPFEITTSLLLSALMASAGVALLQIGPAERRRGTRAAALYALGASLLFAITDILVQGSARTLGIGFFQPTLFLTVAVMIPLLGRHGRAPVGAHGPLLAGSVLMGFQTSLVILVIGIFGQAALVNVIYSTRSLWAVVVDRALGEPHIRRFMIPRTIGALLVTGAVVLAILQNL